jgi:hypothetical protein
MNKYSFNRNADINQENGGTANNDAPASNLNETIAPPASNVSGQAKSIAQNVPSQTTLIGTIAEISKALVSKTTGKLYRRITIVGNDQKSRIYAMSEGFFEVNEDRLIADKSVSLTIDHTVADKTTYVDKTTGEVILHKNTGESIANVVSATSQQAKMSSLKILEDIATKYQDQPALAGALLNATAMLLR